LQDLDLVNNNIDDDGLELLVNGVAHLNRLQKLFLSRNPLITIRGWTNLSTLLEKPHSNLEVLQLSESSLDDEKVQVLIKGIANGNTTLQEICLSNNDSITIEGWRVVATLLEMPRSNLKSLNLYNNNIGDDGVRIFAKALVNNSTLKIMGLHDNRITPEGWAYFKKLLCDTSSVNKTYTSNHVLTFLGASAILSDIESNLSLNRLENKDEIPMRKILYHHAHFDMQPFFEWEFKVLPIMIEWFVKAAAVCTTDEQKISKMKLSVMHDFIKEFPMLYIEPVTRKEIAEYTTMEEELLQGGLDAEQEVSLEEIRGCKARAMRRLGMK